MIATEPPGGHASWGVYPGPCLSSLDAAYIMAWGTHDFDAQDAVKEWQDLQEDLGREARRGRR